MPRLRRGGTIAAAAWRPHPLSEDGSAIGGIRQERALLAELRGEADLVIDTSEYSIHQVRRLIYRELTDSASEEPGRVVSYDGIKISFELQSFGSMP